MSLPQKLRLHRLLRHIRFFVQLFLRQRDAAHMRFLPAHEPELPLLRVFRAVLFRTDFI